MRIVWLAPQPPIPPMTGGRERARRMIDHLAARHEIHLVTYAAPDEQAGLDTLSMGSVTRIDYPRWPERTRRDRAQRVEGLIGEVSPDAIHIQSGAMWGLVPEGFKGKRVLDFHDAPAPRDRMFSPGPLARFWGYRPPFSIGGPDAIITVSPGDAEAVETYHPGCPIIVLPNGVDVSAWSSVPQDIPTEPVLLFPAALNWPPNSDSIREFIDTLARLTQKVPDVRLVVAGHAPDAELVRAITADPAVSVVANPPDMRPLFAQAAAVIVPLLYGTGTRIKILQALAAGRPVVSTAVGAAGLGLEPDTHLLVAEMTDPFVDALARLLSDPALGRTLAGVGREVVGRHDWSNFLPILDAIYPPHTS